jgi:hypothetical protein
MSMTIQVTTCDRHHQICGGFKPVHLDPSPLPFYDCISNDNAFIQSIKYLHAKIFGSYIFQ